MALVSSKVEESSVEKRSSSQSLSLNELPDSPPRVQKPILPIGWRVLVLVLTCLSSCKYHSSLLSPYIESIV